jgi:hypothetical protein
MPARTHGERIDRLEQVVGLLAEGQLNLEKLLADLATETRRGFDQVAAQFAETDRRMRETDERMRETDQRMREGFRQTEERFRETDERDRRRSREFDERVDKLVVAIGEFIRNQGSPRA